MVTITKGDRRTLLGGIIGAATGGGGGGTPVDNTFDYANNDIATDTSAAAFSIRGNVLLATHEITITHLRFYCTEAATSGVVALAALDTSIEVTSILASAAYSDTVADVWTEVELEIPVTLAKDTPFLIALDRRDSLGNTANGLAEVDNLVYQPPYANFMLGWRNNDGDLDVGSGSPSTYHEAFALDYKGTVEAEAFARVTARQWSLRFPDEPPSTYYWFEEVELRTSVGGVQAAIDGTTGEAAARTSLSGYGPELAFDGQRVAGNGWSTVANPAEGENLTFDFDEATAVEEIYIFGKGGSYEPLRMELRYNDGSGWTLYHKFYTPAALWGLGDALSTSDIVLPVFRNIAKDPYIDNVVYVNNTWTTTRDNSPAARTVTETGTPVLDSSEQLNGRNTLLLDGSNGLAVDDTDVLASIANTDDFTWEAWVRLDAEGTLNTFVSKRDGSSAEEGVLRTVADDTVLFAAFRSGSAAIAMNSDDPLVVGEWYHVAGVRADGVYSLYIAGVAQTGSGATGNQPTSNAGNIHIGRNAFNSDRNMEGNIGPVRITQGVARYTGNFTPPETFPTS